MLCCVVSLYLPSSKDSSCVGYDTYLKEFPEAMII